LAKVIVSQKVAQFMQDCINKGMRSSEILAHYRREEDSLSALLSYDELLNILSSGFEVAQSYKIIEERLYDAENQYSQAVSEKNNITADLMKERMNSIRFVLDELGIKI
jgi:hypothetical protein